jgi:predicted transcriptional regulator
MIVAFGSDIITAGAALGRIQRDRFVVVPISFQEASQSSFLLSGPSELASSRAIAIKVRSIRSIPAILQCHPPSAKVLSTMRVFRLGKKGSGSVLGPLEQEVMEAIWDSSAAMTVAQVQRALGPRKNLLAYSTVKAILSNLSEKGHLKKSSEGRSNVFVATETHDRFQERVVTEVVETLAKNYRHPLLAHLVGELATDKKSLEELEHLVAEKRRELIKR